MFEQSTEGSKPTTILRAIFRAVPAALHRKECFACHLLRCNSLRLHLQADSSSTRKVNVFKVISFASGRAELCHFEKNLGLLGRLKEAKSGSHFGCHWYRELVHHSAPSCTRDPA